MSFLKSTFKNYPYLVIFSLSLFLFFLVFNVFSWTLPTANPPNNDLSPPLDTSSVEQTKSGNLILENNLTVGGILRLGRFSSHPTGTNGALYYNTTDNKFYGYSNNSWQELGGGGGFWTLSNNNIYNTNSGNVGIGTTEPTAKLEINAAGVSGPGGWLKGIHFTPKSHSAITLKNPDTGKGGLLFGLHGINQKFYFGHYNPDDSWDKYLMVIDAINGNVGIGPTSPTEKLEVSGNIKLSGATPTYRITNVASPINDSDVATKGYVDAQAGSSIVNINSITTQCTVTGGSGYFTIYDVCPEVPPERYIWNQGNLSDTDGDGCLESDSLPGFCLVRGPNGWIEPKYSQQVLVDLTSSINSFCGNYANPTLTWSTLGASSCTASGGWSGTKATSGSETITNITNTTTFTLTCTGSNRQPGIKSVTVKKTVSCSMILIYMSSGDYNGALGGRNGADAKCDLGGALGCQVHKAFLSVNNVDYIANFPTRWGVNNRLPIYWYSKLDGNITKLANNWADMLDGSILQSQVVGTGEFLDAWTGSGPSGMVAADTCAGWTDGTDNSTGVHGHGDTTNSSWISCTVTDNCSWSGHRLRCLCQK